MAPFLFDAAADDDDNDDSDEEEEEEEEEEDEDDDEDGDENQDEGGEPGAGAGFFFDAQIIAEVDVDMQEAASPPEVDGDHAAGQGEVAVEGLFENDSDAEVFANVQVAGEILQLQLEQAAEEELEGVNDGEDNEAVIAPQDVIDIDNSDVEDLEMEAEIESTTSEPGFSEQDTSDGHLRIPSIARWRLNLTALSQKYNLYFAAYRDKIHVSRPRSCATHNLPSVPDLMLRPGPSPAALLVGAQLDPMFPHQVNHLLVQDFGSEEILLMAYDDGDVIGFYTRGIEAAVVSREWHGRNKAYSPNLRPFFQENVRVSAWGLAVHAKSRVIAVGSNLHEVTVFIPALSGQPFQPLEGSTLNSRVHYYGIHKDPVGNPQPDPRDTKLCLGDNNADWETRIRRRDVSWRIRFGPLGDNIPNVTFSSDKSGNADKIVAIDVKGNIWLMDLWEFGTQFQVIRPLHRGPPGTLPGDVGRPRGWGVIVIDRNSFLPTRGYEDSLGLPESEISHMSHPEIGAWVDNSKSVVSIPHNSLEHPWTRSRSERRPLIDFHRLLDTEWWFSRYAGGNPWRVKGPFPGSNVIDKMRNMAQKPNPVLADESSIMRLYETDIELRSHEKYDGVGIMMQHATKQIQPRPAGLPVMRWAHERLSNYHYLPELSLVVAGSMCGRVALITLTQTLRNDLLFKRGFKIEAILPTKQDEDERRRPICPLFGVAVGPLPVDGRPDVYTKPRHARRFRIMMQYYDQRILSYEISRGVESDVLRVS